MDKKQATSTGPIDARLCMPVVKLITLLSISFIFSCSLMPKSTNSLKPYSSLFGNLASCEIGNICDYTGYFERHSSIEQSAVDVIYTYDDNDKCVLIIANQNELEAFDSAVNEASSLSSGKLSITGKAMRRDQVDYWSDSTFCNDSNWVLSFESVDAVLVIHH